MDAKTLLQAVRVVKPLVGRTNPNIFIESNGVFSLEATDGDSWISYRLPAIDGEFDRVVPGKLFEDIVAASGNEIRFDLGDDKLMVNDLPVPAWETNAWPLEPQKAESGLCVTVQVKPFIDALSKALNVASKDDERMSLNSVLFDGEAACLVGSNGHRILTVPVDWIEPKIKRPVHRSTVDALIKSLKASKLREVTLRWYTGVFVVSHEDTYRFVGKIEVGDYPNYKKITEAKPSGPVVRCDKADLMRGLRQMRTLASDRNKGTSLYLGAYGIELRVTHPDLGTGRYWVDTDTDLSDTNGETVNARYFIDAVQRCADSRVTLTFPEGDQVGMLVNDELLMPMRDGKTTDTPTAPACAKRYVFTEAPKKAAKRPRAARKAKPKVTPKPKKKSQETVTEDGYRLVSVKGHWRTSKTGKKTWVNKHVRRFRNRTTTPLKKAA